MPVSLHNINIILDITVCIGSCS